MKKFLSIIALLAFTSCAGSVKREYVISQTDIKGEEVSHHEEETPSP